MKSTDTRTTAVLSMEDSGKSHLRASSWSLSSCAGSCSIAVREPAELTITAAAVVIEGGECDGVV